MTCIFVGMHPCGFVCEWIKRAQKRFQWKNMSNIHKQSKTKQKPYVRFFQSSRNVAKMRQGCHYKSYTILVVNIVIQPFKINIQHL